MPVQDKFVEFCIERCGLLGSIDSKYMFGGWCLYCDGAVFALVADGALFLKGDEANIPEFQSHGFQAFRPFPDKPDTMKYFQAHPSDGDKARQGNVQLDILEQQRK